MLDARRARITPWSGQGAELLKYRHVNAMQMQGESCFKTALHARQAAVQLDVPMKESDLIQPDEENKMASFLMHWAMGHGAFFSVEAVSCQEPERATYLYGFVPFAEQLNGRVLT